jgi:hypothetical protein
MGRSLSKKQYSIATDLATLPKFQRRQNFRAMAEGVDRRFLPLEI